MRRLLAIILSAAMLIGLAACSVGSAATEVPSKNEARRAAEKKYDMEFVLDDYEIAKDESSAEWVFISEDGTLEVTVSWSAKHPDEFEFDDKELKDSGSRETGETAVSSETEATAATTTEDTYYIDPDMPTYGRGSKVINLWSFTVEVPNMIAKYIELNPEFGEEYTVVCTITATDGGAYQTALDAALAAG